MGGIFFFEICISRFDFPRAVLSRFVVDFIFFLVKINFTVKKKRKKERIRSFPAQTKGTWKFLINNKKRNVLCNSFLSLCEIWNVVVKWKKLVVN